MVRQGRHFPIKGLDPEAKLDKNYLDESLMYFKETVKAVFVTGEVQLPLPAESIYKRLQISFRLGNAKHIYDQLSRHCNTGVEYLAQQWFERCTNNNIEYVHELWKKFQRQMKYIGSLFQVIDQGYVKNSNLLSTRKMCIKYWGLHVMNDDMCKRIVNDLIANTNNEREGSKQSIGGEDITELLEMCKLVNKEEDNVSLYDKDFKYTYHTQIDDFYLKQSKEWIKMEVPAYLEIIKRKFKEEKKREYSTDMALVNRIMIQRLVADHAKTILREGLQKLLEREDKKHLKLLYYFFKQDESSLELFNQHFANYIKLYGSKTVQCDSPIEESKKLLRLTKTTLDAHIKEKENVEKEDVINMCKGFSATLDQFINADWGSKQSQDETMRKELSSFWNSLNYITSKLVGNDEFQTKIKEYSSVSQERKMIEELLRFKDVLDCFVSDLFENNKDFTESIQKSFERFLNNEDYISADLFIRLFKDLIESEEKVSSKEVYKKNREDLYKEKSPKLLAKYIDVLLRDGRKVSKGEDGDKELDKIIRLMRFIDQKDIFWLFYQRTLSKRLLHNLSADNDIERTLISKLTTEFGNELTKTVEGMFKDLDISKQDIMKSYKESNPDSTLDVRILGSNIWNSVFKNKANEKINIPQELKEIESAFESFYKTQRSSVKLTWTYSVYYCEVLVNYKPRLEKRFRISFYQLLCLLPFQEKDDCTYEEIRKASGLDETTLERTLKSLHAGKYKVIKKVIKKSKNKEATAISDSKFIFNKEFSSNRNLIRIKELRQEETREEDEMTMKTVKEDRRNLISLALVRLMKTRKTLTYNELKMELGKDSTLYKIIGRITFDNGFKQIIESLIERGYMDREEGYADRFIYNAG